MTPRAGTPSHASRSETALKPSRFEPPASGLDGVERGRRGVEVADEVGERVRSGHRQPVWCSPMGSPVPRRCDVSLIVRIERCPVPAAITRWIDV